MSDADAVTDLLNNQIGRRIGEINNGNTIKEFSLKVLDEYFKNGLYSLRYGDDDYWYVKKNKIPQSEYLKLKKIYSLADNNGFLPGDDKNINFGLMYHGITYADEAYDEATKGKMTARFWRPVMENGVIRFTRPEECPHHKPLRDMEMKTFSEELDNFAGLKEFGEVT